jgi:uncharacterized FlaG/YvyC family protein
MEITPVSQRPQAPTDATLRPSASTELMRATVAAVRALNRPELLGEDRELLFARDSETRKPIVKIVSRKTGEVLEQMPPEGVLRIMAELEKQGSGGGVV